MKTRSKYLCYIIATFFLIAVTAYSMGIYINTTESVATGIWICEPSQIDRGDTVIILKDKIPHLTQNTGPVRHFIKEVLGVPGDIVDYDELGSHLIINGQPLPRTEIKKSDSDGKPVIVYTRYPLTVADGYYFVGSKHPYGYDSRYFGPISQNAVKSKVRLILGFN